MLCYRNTAAAERKSARSHQLSLAYEMQVEDLDGNVLRLGSDSREMNPRESGWTWRASAGFQFPEGGWRLVG